MAEIIDLIDGKFIDVYLNQPKNSTISYKSSREVKIQTPLFYDGPWEVLIYDQNRDFELCMAAPDAKQDYDAHLAFIQNICDNIMLDECKVYVDAAPITLNNKLIGFRIINPEKHLIRGW